MKLWMCRRWHALAVTAALLWAGLTGCGRAPEGPDRRAVEGTVAYDGEPVRYGMIRFLPDPSGPVATAIIADGKYSLSGKSGVPVGDVRVEISAMPNTVGMSEDEILAKGPPPVKAIPSKYNSESTLKEEIFEGAEVFELNFDLAK